MKDIDDVVLAYEEALRLGKVKVSSKETIREQVDKYRAAGIEEISDARVFRLPPFLEMGQAPGVVRRFGSTAVLQNSLHEMQRRIYAN